MLYQRKYHLLQFTFHTNLTLFSTCVFNGKEKDNESGFHYYGSRYYNSELSMWLTDPMSSLRSNLSGYNYCQDNPVILIDNDGKLDGKYVDEKGKTLGYDENFDFKIHVVVDKDYKKEIKRNEKAKKTTKLRSDKIKLTTTLFALNEIIDVHNRTDKNGGSREEASVVSDIGIIHRAETGTAANGDIEPKVILPIGEDGSKYEGYYWTNIHSHPFIGGYYANLPSDDDLNVFKNFGLNIIVGKLDISNNQIGATFYSNKGNRPIWSFTIKEIQKILSTPWVKIDRQR